MTTQTVTLDLPEPVIERLKQAADTMQRSVEEIIEQTIQGNLPPALSDVPLALQAEADILQGADSQALWQIAQEQMPKSQWERHEELLGKKQDSLLSESEQEELGGLRESADLFVLRRSYALALLKWRGHALPFPSPNGN